MKTLNLEMDVSHSNLLRLPEGMIHRSQPRTIPDARFASGLALALARSEKNMTRLAGKSYLK